MQEERYSGEFMIEGSTQAASPGAGEVVIATACENIHSHWGLPLFAIFIIEKSSSIEFIIIVIVVVIAIVAVVAVAAGR